MPGCYDLPKLHSPTGRDAVELLAGDGLPSGAGHPLPVRQTQRPAVGLTRHTPNLGTPQGPPLSGLCRVWWPVRMAGYTAGYTPRPLKKRPRGSTTPFNQRYHS